MNSESAIRKIIFYVESLASVLMKECYRRIERWQVINGFGSAAWDVGLTPRGLCTHIVRPVWVPLKRSRKCPGTLCP